MSTTRERDKKKAHEREKKERIVFQFTKRETSPYKRALVKSRTKRSQVHTHEEEEEEKRFFVAFSYPVERERGTVPGLRRWKREARNATTRKNRRPPFRFLKKPRGRRERERERERERWRRCRLRRPRRCFIRRLLLSGRTSARVRGETR